MTARALLFPVILALAGCATMFSGTSQKITVATTPAGAACTLTRDGVAVGSIAATPGTLEVGKGSGYLKITCTKAGYLDAVVTAVSHYNTSTLWNHAGFGIIGLGVDAGSGAMYHYVPDVAITMIDEEFDSEASRDATFYGIRRIAEVEHRNSPDLAARLAEIEKKRLAAKVKR